MSLTYSNSRFCARGQTGPDFKQGLDRNALHVGAFSGRNWQLGSGWLAGVQADIGRANNRSAGGPSITNGDAAAVNLQCDASLRRGPAA